MSASQNELRLSPGHNTNIARRHPLDDGVGRDVGIDRYFRPMASRLRFRLNHNSKCGSDSDKRYQIGGFMTNAVATMKAAQVTAAGAGLRIVELEVPDPGPGQVRIKVQACGVCHSDAIIVEGRRPGIPYPRVPGHEVAGVVDALGTGVTEWRKGQRVGVGWHGGHDGTCPECRQGDFRLCRNEKNPGISYDGGYQEYMLAPVEALVSIPDSLSDIEAAPCCALEVPPTTPCGMRAHCRVT
jgi:hypothetical protein